MGMPLATRPALAQPPGQDVFPVTPKTKWVYNTGSSETVTEIIGTERLDNRDCIKSVTRVGGEIKATVLTFIKADGHYTAKVNNFKLDPPMKSLPLPLKLGDSWSVASKLVDAKLNAEVSIKYEFRIKDSKEKVKVPAGEFEAFLIVCETDTGGFLTTSKQWYVPGKGPVKTVTSIKGAETILELSECNIVTPPRLNAAIIGNITLSSQTVEKEASTEAVEALPGVVTEFEKSRTITREASFTFKVGAGAEVETKLAADFAVVKGEISTKIKGSIEKETGEKLTDSETRKQSVKIDGDKLQKAKIVWIDVYRTGTIEVTSDGKAYKVPFEFPIGTKLVVQKP
jgi:hypothetical protein